MQKPLGVEVTLEDFDNAEAPYSRMNELLWFTRNVPGLRCTFDMGNFAFGYENVMDAYELLKNYIVHVHCKDRGSEGQRLAVCADRQRLHSHWAAGQEAEGGWVPRVSVHRAFWRTRPDGGHRAVRALSEIYPRACLNSGNLYPKNANYAKCVFFRQFLLYNNLRIVATIYLTMLELLEYSFSPK